MKNNPSDTSLPFADPDSANYPQRYCRALLGE